MTLRGDYCTKHGGNSAERNRFICLRSDARRDGKPDPIDPDTVPLASAGDLHISKLSILLGLTAAPAILRHAWAEMERATISRGEDTGIVDILGVAVPWHLRKTENLRVRPHVSVKVVDDLRKALRSRRVLAGVEDASVASWGDPELDQLEARLQAVLAASGVDPADQSSILRALASNADLAAGEASS